MGSGAALPGSRLNCSAKTYCFHFIVTMRLHLAIYVQRVILASDEMFRSFSEVNNICLVYFLQFTLIVKWKRISRYSGASERPTYSYKNKEQLKIPNGHVGTRIQNGCRVNQLQGGMSTVM